MPSIGDRTKAFLSQFQSHPFLPRVFMPTPAPPSLGDPQFRPQAPSPSNYAEMYQKFMSDQANNAFQQDQVMGTVSPPAPSDFSSYQDFLPDGAFKKQDSMWGGSGVPAPQPSSIYDYTGYIPNSSFK
jgi:hypothetical protein